MNYLGLMRNTAAYVLLDHPVTQEEPPPRPSSMTLPTKRAFFQKSRRLWGERRTRFLPPQTVHQWNEYSASAPELQGELRPLGRLHSSCGRALLDGWRLLGDDLDYWGTWRSQDFRVPQQPSFHREDGEAQGARPGLNCSQTPKRKPICC